MPVGQSLFQDTRVRADDVFEVAAKKFMMALQNRTISLPQSGTFDIPPYDTQEFAYIAGGAADDDDVATITYKSAGEVVATLTFVYYLNTNNVQSITQT